MDNITLRLQRLERLLDISRELTSTVSLEPLLHKIVRAAADLTGSEMASILLLYHDPKELRFVAASNLVGQLADIAVPVDSSIAGAAFSSGEPLIVHDVNDDPRYYKVVEDLVGVEAHSLLAVPLQFKDRRIGTLEAENKLDGEFGQEDVETLTVLAAQATVAIENARLLEALRRARDELEQRVVERTAELSAANVALQQRNEDLDAFGHTVAHDLRGPVGNITSYAEILAGSYDEFSDEERSESYRSIARNGHKALNIIDELLLLAGLRAAKPRMEPLDMASVVEEARKRLADLLEKHQVTITLPRSWPVALGYAPWVEEVWVNYLSNAVKYGGRPPHVELGAVVQPDGQVRFWVRDNGQGLTPEEQARLFTPFTQLDQLDLKGHGLGLSIVRRIVEKLDGEVGVESQVGQGSVFSFTLPGVQQRTEREFR